MGAGTAKRNGAWDACAKATVVGGAALGTGMGSSVGGAGGRRDAVSSSGATVVEGGEMGSMVVGFDDSGVVVTEGAASNGAEVEAWSRGRVDNLSEG